MPSACWQTDWEKPRASPYADWPERVARNSVLRASTRNKILEASPGNAKYDGPVNAFEVLGLDHVQIAIPKDGEARAREFFVNLLGWTEMEKPANLRVRGGAWFQCGQHQIHVGVTDAFIPAKKAHPAFLVRGIAEYRKHLETLGLKPRDEDPLPGAVRFYLDDPFGNRLEFLERKS